MTAKERNDPADELPAAQVALLEALRGGAQGDRLVRAFERCERAFESWPKTPPQRQLKRARALAALLASEVATAQNAVALELGRVSVLARMLAARRGPPLTGGTCDVSG